MLSRRRPPPGIEVVLQDQRGRERVQVLLPARRPSAHLPDGVQRTRRREALVPQIDGEPGPARDVTGELACLVRRLAFGPVGRERQSYHDSGRAVLLDEREESLHREALPGTARERSERL